MCSARAKFKYYWPRAGRPVRTRWSCGRLLVSTVASAVRTSTVHQLARWRRCRIHWHGRFRLAGGPAPPLTAARPHDPVVQSSCLSVSFVCHSFSPSLVSSRFFTAPRSVSKPSLLFVRCVHVVENVRYQNAYTVCFQYVAFIAYRGNRTGNFFARLPSSAILTYSGSRLNARTSRELSHLFHISRLSASSVIRVVQIVRVVSLFRIRVHRFLYPALHPLFALVKGQIDLHEVN